MRVYGYTNIRPIGGIKDYGQDAIHIPFYISDSTKVVTVFQYSLEKTTYSKIKKTIKRLNDQEIEFDKFVYVTTVSISETKDREFKAGIRNTYSLDIEIYDRKRITAVLADMKNNIYIRYFPDIEAQFKNIIDNSSIMSQKREEALLRTTLMLNYGESTKQAFSSIYENIVLSILMGESPKGLDFQAIETALKTNLTNFDYDSQKLMETLSKLVEISRLKIENGLYFLTDTNQDLFVILYEQHQQPLHVIVKEVIDVIRTQKRDSLDIKYLDTLYNNCQEAIVDYCRLFGNEYINSEDEKHVLSSPDVGKCLDHIISKNLPKNVSTLLMIAIGEVLKNPSEDVSRALTQLLYTYISAAILNLDPELQNVLSSRIKDREFIIDTDVLIDCIVKENPKSESYISIIEGLIKAKCKVIIPLQSFQECIEHASYSTKTYNYFKDTLLALPSEAIEDEVWNGFVQGYYYGITGGTIPMTMKYDKYLRNYFDPANRTQFMISIIRATLGNEVVVSTTEKLAEGIIIPTDVLDRLTNEIFTALYKAKKADYRSEAQNLALAKNDADLYLCTYYLNHSLDLASERFLEFKYYLVTSSNRIGAIAYKLGLKDRVTTKLPLLATLLNQVSKDSISPKAFIGLLENPFLIYAMEQCKNDINKLVKAGVDLQGVSIVRLRSDLDNLIHDRLTNLDKCMESSETEKNDAANDVISVLEDMDDLGYSLTPKISSLVKEYKNKVQQLDEKDKALDKYKDVVEKFSKRRQKYFERIRKGEK
jgi:uncharacterized protein (UPF0335 family)